MPSKEFYRLASTALALPTRQRVQLAQELWTSIDDRADEMPLEKGMVTELKRRDREISDGKVCCKTHKQSLKTARKALGREQ
jgi:putative addiction module component (TIGR02574 family)